MLKDSLIKTATKVIQQFGYDGVLSEPQSTAQYDVTTGRAEVTFIDHSIKYVKDNYTTAEIQTGLYGIEDFKAVLVFPKEIEKSWKLDGANIISVTQIGLQNGSVVQELQCRL